jgi:hypothetical protein
VSQTLPFLAEPKAAPVRGGITAFQGSTAIPAAAPLSYGVRRLDGGRMSLDIGIGDGSSLVPVPGEPSLFLDDDGYYWFLHPLFGRLQAETGQYIDLYGDASFVGESLAALERLLLEARTLIESQPDTWDVHVGTQILPKGRDLFKVEGRKIVGNWESVKEVFKAVHRDQFLELIARWEKVIARARELGRPVVCFGD